MKYEDIPLFPRAYYEVDYDWGDIEHAIERYSKNYGLELDPDFQRAHVWTYAQQQAYIEYVLRGGEVGKNLTFVSKNWSHGNAGPLILVDGKQRLEAVRAFMRDEVTVFGRKKSEFIGHLRYYAGFKFRICDLSTREEILQLYLNINAGGTPHTKEELDKVRAMLNRQDAIMPM